MNKRQRKKALKTKRRKFNEWYLDKLRDGIKQKQRSKSKPSKIRGQSVSFCVIDDPFCEVRK